MQQRLSKIHPSPDAAATSVKGNEALVSAVPPSAAPAAWDEAHQMRQINALYSLLENRYVDENPMPQSLRRPSSNPDHYDGIVRELEEAPNRTWLGALVKRVKGSLRFS